MKEYLTDPAEVLTQIGKHEIELRKAGPVGGINVDRFGLWRRVPNRLMRHLIGAGLVEMPGLRWSNGSWVYRLTPLGQRLMQPKVEYGPDGDIKSMDLRAMGPGNVQVSWEE